MGLKKIATGTYDSCYDGTIRTAGNFQKDEINRNLPDYLCLFHGNNLHLIKSVAIHYSCFAYNKNLR